MRQKKGEQKRLPPKRRGEGGKRKPFPEVSRSSLGGGTSRVSKKSGRDFREEKKHSALIQPGELVKGSIYPLPTGEGRKKRK